MPGKVCWWKQTTASGRLTLPVGATTGIKLTGDQDGGAAGGTVDSTTLLDDWKSDAAKGNL